MKLAHINTNNGTEQSVTEHCKAVSDLAREFGEKAGLGETAALAGLVHDIGKNSNEFQEYLRYSAAHPDDHSRRGTVIHSAQGGKLIYDRFFSEDPYQRLTAQLLALVTSSHHSGMPDIVGPDGIDDFIQKINPRGDIYFEECVDQFIRFPVEIPFINEKFYKSRDEIIEIINKLKQANISNSFSLHMLAKYLFSCLIDADRLDTYNFMSGIEERAKAWVSGSPTGLWNELSEKLEEGLKKFNQESRIARLRSEISEECKEFAHYRPGIYQLCVPTGGGKTLSSFRFALEHAKIKEYEKERIFYIIPYTSIIEQNAKVIADIIQRKDVVLEHHSNIVRDNGDEAHALLTERWDCPIVLTTMVQFLNTLFSGGTGDIRRMHQLADSVIIFDEIQILPIKCVHLFNDAINFLSKICNATVILCTATQPLLHRTEKPLLLSEPVNIMDRLEERFDQFKRVHVEPALVDEGYCVEELVDFISEKLEAMRETKNVLVIMNTKRAARELFLRFKQWNTSLDEKERFHIYHLSTSLCAEHRTNILNELGRKLKSERIICVSTQLIEAGIDISFRCVVRAIAGLDSIAQAAGRCNRHGDKQQGVAYIVNIRNENLSRLPDIKKGQECTERILAEYQANPTFFGNDLLSPKAMERYFYYYFHDRKNEMDYAVKKENLQLFDLLSMNTKGLDAYRSRWGNIPQYPLNQAFKTTGEMFCVIDQHTTTVVVPYDRGEELITLINGNCGIKECKAYIREAQRYSVNLYEEDIKKIGKGIYPLKNGGVLALDKRFYDPELGAIFDGKPMEYLDTSNMIGERG